MLSLEKIITFWSIKLKLIKSIVLLKNDEKLKIIKIKKTKILKKVVSSKFNSNFSLEAKLTT